jgi:hypothetical protein
MDMVRTQLLSRMEVLNGDGPEQKALERELEENEKLAKILAGAIRTPLIHLDACGVVVLSPKPINEPIP